MMTKCWNEKGVEIVVILAQVKVLSQNLSLWTKKSISQDLHTMA